MVGKSGWNLKELIKDLHFTSLFQHLNNRNDANNTSGGIGFQ